MNGHNGNKIVPYGFQTTTFMVRCANWCPDPTLPNIDVKTLLATGNSRAAMVAANSVDVSAVANPCRPWMLTRQRQEGSPRRKLEAPDFEKERDKGACVNPSKAFIVLIVKCILL